MCFKVEKCCCFDLKTGCMIIGIVDIVLQLVVIITTSVGLSNGTETAGSGATGIVGAVLSVFAAAFLILGTMKDKAGYLMFWVVLKGISLVIYCIIFIILIVAVIAVGATNDVDGASVGAIVFLIILEGVIIGLNIYWWAVVRSYKAELSEGLPR
ncbi:hypothetical protein ACFFRR_003158 [Megaselia abdita]